MAHLAAGLLLKAVGKKLIVIPSPGPWRAYPISQSSTVITHLLWFASVVMALRCGGGAGVVAALVWWQG